MGVPGAAGGVTEGSGSLGGGVQVGSPAGRGECGVLWGQSFVQEGSGLKGR